MLSKRERKRTSVRRLGDVLMRVDKATNNRRLRIDSQVRRSDRMHLVLILCTYFGGAVLWVFGLAALLDLDEFPPGPIVASVMLVVGVVAWILLLPLSFSSYFSKRRRFEQTVSKGFKRICGYLTSDMYEWSSTIERGWINSAIGSLADDLLNLGPFMNVSDKQVLQRIDRVSGGVRIWQRDVNFSDDRRVGNKQMLEEVVAGYIDFLNGRWERIADGEPVEPSSKSPWIMRKWIVLGVFAILTAIGIAVWQAVRDSSNLGGYIVAAVLISLGSGLLGKGGVKDFDLKAGQEAARGFAATSSDPGE